MTSIEPEEEPLPEKVHLPEEEPLPEVEPLPEEEFLPDEETLNKEMDEFDVDEIVKEEDSPPTLFLLK